MRPDATFEAGWDAWVVHSANTFATRHSWLGDMAVFSASTLSNALIVLLILYIISRHENSIQLCLLVVVVMLAAWLVARGFQLTWLRPRPFEAGVAEALIPHRGSSSFPSTHASVIFAIGWLGIALRARWHFIGLWWILGLTVVTGRVICALHYPSDVIGGLIVGAVCMVLGVLVARMAGLRLNTGWI